MRWIVAGIDEAGYGPILGPLCVGCHAAAVEADGPPDLWDLLRRVTSKKRDTRKIHVADSKKVHVSKDLSRLETAALGMIGPDWRPDVPSLPWYQTIGPIPISVDATAVTILHNAYVAECDRLGVETVHHVAHVYGEDVLNQRFAATKNKASVLFTATAVHLQNLLGDFAEPGVRLHITCDQHGGRDSYTGLLRDMFGDWDLTVVEETDGISTYDLAQGGAIATVRFAEKADNHCYSAAAASILAKYAREALMHRFNAWWAERVSDLKPTAGYWTDGLRFLEDISNTRTALGLDEAALRRSR
ncbi:MAG: hypothetical protein AAGD32_08725 [Planctomycetota bacterium]